jgi:hypothetical protein
MIFLRVAMTKAGLTDVEKENKEEKRYRQSLLAHHRPDWVPAGHFVFALICKRENVDSSPDKKLGITRPK